ncbi:MAG: hypothetical protein J0H02_14375 [Armatimonadetes bacterium]|nr:hypothetical protein [Armatimonadota bacterium]
MGTLLIVSVHRLKRLIRDYPNHPLAKNAQKYKNVYAGELHGNLDWQKGDDD